MGERDGPAHLLGGVLVVVAIWLLLGGWGWVLNHLELALGIMLPLVLVLALWVREERR